jgi:hypothetical protein
MYIYKNHTDTHLLSVEMKFIKMSKKTVGYDKGICIEIKGYTIDDYNFEYTLGSYSYPYPIFEGEILWNPLSKMDKEFDIDVADLKKFCEKIVKLKIFE